MYAQQQLLTKTSTTNGEHFSYCLNWFPSRFFFITAAGTKNVEVINREISTFHFGTKKSIVNLRPKRVFLTAHRHNVHGLIFFPAFFRAALCEGRNNRNPTLEQTKVEYFLYFFIVLRFPGFRIEDAISLGPRSNKRGTKLVRRETVPVFSVFRVARSRTP